MNLHTFNSNFENKCKSIIPKVKLKSKFINSISKDKLNEESNELEKKIIEYTKKITNKLIEISPMQIEKKTIQNNKLSKYNNITLNLPYLNLIPFEFLDETYEILNYIFEKKKKTENDNFYIQHFLTNFTHFISEMNKSKLLSNTNILLNQISQYMKIYHLHSNQLLFRFGDFGDKFYFIFKGKVAVLVPKKIQFEFTYNSYIEYIDKLYNSNEFGLLLKIIDENISIFNSIEILEYKNLIYNFLNKKNFNSRIKNRKLSFSKKIIENFTVEEYINSILPNIKEENSKKEYSFLINQNNENLTNPNYSFKNFFPQNSPLKKNLSQKTKNRKSLILSNKYSKTKILTIYTYYQIGILNQFSTFGEISLSNLTSYRTATIITLDNCILGHIENKIYSKCIKSSLEILRYKNIVLLKKIPLFKDISIELFNEKYFNNFHLKIYKRGENIFNQKEERNKIFIIKEGEIILSMKSSIKDLNKIIFNFSPDDILERNKLIKEKKFEDDFYADFYNNDNQIYYLKILYQYQYDIFGLDDCIFNEKYFLSATCKTEICFIYEIDLEFFYHMMNENSIYENYINYLNFKKNQMLNRLKYIRTNRIKLKYFEKENSHLEFKKNKKYSFNVNLIRNKLDEKMLFLKKKNVNLESNNYINNSFSNSKNKNNSPQNKIKYITQNTTSNSSIINSFSQLKNFSSPKSSRNTINNLKKTIPKRNIKTKRKSKNKNLKIEINYNKTNNNTLNNNNNIIDNYSLNYNKKIHHLKSYSSLNTYIKNVKIAKLKKPKIDIFSDIMFKLNSADFQKNKFSNNIEEDNKVDFLVFDNFIQNKVNKYSLKKKKERNDYGFKGTKLKLIFKNYVAKEND